MNCEYQHKVNKKEIPVCNILGVNIAAINMEWLLDFTDKNIKDLSGDYMCCLLYTSITDFEEVVKLDTQYISEWSLRLDVKILWKTVWSVFKSDGAM